jgi:hypothetical protein
MTEQRADPDMQTTIYFPRDLYRWLKNHAVEERTSLTRIVVGACQQLRQQHEEQ